MLERFVREAEQGEVPFATLCARFGISRKTGYKWLKRFRLAGLAGLEPRSRQPKSSPRKTPDAVADMIVDLRRANPAWSGARLRAELERLGIDPLPAASTIDLILRRRREAASFQLQTPGKDALQYEPNFRWVLSISNNVDLLDGTSVSILAIRDGPSGFVLAAKAATKPHDGEVQALIADVFARQGLPWRISIPRPRATHPGSPCECHSPLTVWLMRLGIAVEFDFNNIGRDGADIDGEARLKLAKELITLPAYQRGRLAEAPHIDDPVASFAIAAGQSTSTTIAAALEQMRDHHNASGGGDGFQRRSPLSLYRPSRRTLPDPVPLPAYPPEAEVRLVSEKGILSFQRRLIYVGRAFAGLYVELKPTVDEDLFVASFAGQVLGFAQLSDTEVDTTTSLELTAPCP